MATNLSNSQQIRQVIKSEYKKCALDVTYFLKKYCIIQHPIKGKVHFDLYDFQENTLRAFLKHRYNIVLKARQIGLSTLVAGYSLWKMLFHNDQNILVIATKQDTAKNLVTKVRVMHQNLPVWLRGNCIEDNKMSLQFANGSQIKAIASSPDAGRSEALSLLILDEAAFIESSDEIWTAAQATLATGGDAIVLSTPNGMGNFFHKTWSNAQNGDNEFHPIFLDWRVHPDRDEAWRDEQTKALGDLEARQEHDADFIASGNTVINGDLIKFFREEYEEPPRVKRGFDNNIWVWEEPNYTSKYIVVADVSRGDGTDYSAFHVIDIESMRQVAEYKGKPSTKDFGIMLVAIATEYNEAILVIENANIGYSVCQEVIDRRYKNLFYMEEDWRYIDDKNPKQTSNRRRQFERKRVPGFTTSVRTRPLIISKLEEYMRDNSIKIRSSRTYDELEVFIWKGSRPEAMHGYNDDLVMSLAISLWVRDIALRLNQEKMDRTRTVLGGIKHSTHHGVYTPTTPFGNPYQVQMGPTGEMEDIRWLLG